MAVYKRGNTWWYSFLFAGRRIQASAKTTSKTVAKLAEKQRRRDLEQNFNGITDNRRERIKTVDEVAATYLEDYALRHPNDRFARYAVGNIVDRLGQTMLPDVTEASITAYQSARLRDNMSPKSINEEVGFLLRLLGDSGELLRARLRKRKRLKLATRDDVGKPWSSDQINRLVAQARKRRSRNFYPALRLSLDTGMRLSEIRLLRWERVDLVRRPLVVEKSKTRAGTGRTIPLSDEAYAALAAHASWYMERFGEVKPEWYVFPFGKPNPTEPTKPVTSFKTAWYKTREAAQVEGRWHDGRHTYITELAESGAGDQTIKDTVGHVSDRMLKHYSHIRMKAKREAMETVMRRRRASEGSNWDGVSTESTTVAGVTDEGSDLTR